MRTAVIVATVVASLGAGASTESLAQSPQSYPYCALDTSSGATSCYYSSRAQCGSRCIPNPSFGGAAEMSIPRRGRSGAPRY